MIARRYHFPISVGKGGGKWELGYTLDTGSFGGKFDSIYFFKCPYPLNPVNATSEYLWRRLFIVPT